MVLLSRDKDDRTANERTAGSWNEIGSSNGIKPDCFITSFVIRPGLTSVALIYPNKLTAFGNVTNITI